MHIPKNGENPLEKENVLELKTMTVNLEHFLHNVEERIAKMRNNKNLYYDGNQDAEIKEIYYNHSPRKLTFKQLHLLVKKTHTNQLPYFVSKDTYLYTWVDLQPNGEIKSIYSGERKHPRAYILGDYGVHMRQEMHQINVDEGEIEAVTDQEREQLKFNAEHIVPQSWFNGREPMKGDLHHLFACEPKCNMIRSNFPYFDFPHYTPESPSETVRNDCGVAVAELFEPEFGKGAVARAMMYFLLRYPKGIKRSYRKKVDVSLLRKWSTEFPPDLYEKHRNQAIYYIQGNRNPFIDFPNLADSTYFPL